MKTIIVKISTAFLFYTLLIGWSIEFVKGQQKSEKAFKPSEYTLIKSTQLNGYINDKNIASDDFKVYYQLVKESQINLVFMLPPGVSICSDCVTPLYMIFQTLENNTNYTAIPAWLDAFDDNNFLLLANYNNNPSFVLKGKGLCMIYKDKIELHWESPKTDFYKKLNENPLGLKGLKSTIDKIDVKISIPVSIQGKLTNQKSDHISSQQTEQTGETVNDEYLKKADEYFDEGDYDNASEFYEKAGLNSDKKLADKFYNTSNFLNAYVLYKKVGDQENLNKCYIKLSDMDFLSIALSNAGISTYRIWLGAELVSLGPSVGDRGNISKNDIEKIEGLGIFNSNFNDLTLISPLKHISYLDLRDNKIEKIEGLETLKKLTYIDLSNNPIDINDVNNKREIDRLKTKGVKVIL